MPETQQQKAIRYWEDAIERIQKKYRKLKVNPEDIGKDSPVWDEFRKLFYLETYAKECLRLAKEGQLKTVDDWNVLSVLDEI